MIYGYLRENEKQVNKEPIDPITGLPRTTLKEYLNIIFPNINDWVFDKTTGLIDTTTGKKSLRRPDARSEQFKLIIEIDGLPHYQNPDIIIRDDISTKFYEDYGYKVVRIPYFIQLSNKAVEQLFNVKVNTTLFDDNFTSLHPELRNTPAYLCPLGIERMKLIFQQFPKQYKMNKQFLEQLNQPLLTGIDYL